MSDKQLIDVEDDEPQQIEVFEEVIEVLETDQVEEEEEEEQKREVKVLLVESPTRQKLVTMAVKEDNTVDEIVKAVGSLVLKNKTLYHLDISAVVDPNYNFDYIVEILDSSGNSETKLDKNVSVKRVRNDSESSTKINLFNLSDKENDETPAEEDKSPLRRAVSIENIDSSRSPSPVLKEDDGRESNTVDLDNNSLLDEEAPKKRALHSRSTHPDSNIITIYPPPPEKGGISINLKDYECLGADEFLNDVIIDFYLSYLVHEVLSPIDRERTHVFSSHFYTRLAKPYQNDDDSNFVNDDARRHAGVLRWTKNINIFEKDFIIIPINERSHWYLIIICFPYLVGDEEKEPFTEIKNTVRDEIQRPCILLFDSLYSKKSSAVTKLRGYLASEYFAKTGKTKSFSLNCMNFIKPKIPKQSNATDCGLFLLQYVENFFKVPIKDFSCPFKSLEDWFEEDVIINKREEISKLICKLGMDFRNGESMDLPDLVFPKKCAISRKIKSDDEDLSEGTSKRENKKTYIVKSNDKSLTNIKKKFSRIIDDDESSTEEVSVPLRAEALDRPLAGRNTLKWYSKKSDTFVSLKECTIPIKLLPCYANSSQSSLDDKPPLKNKSLEFGSPPYFIPKQLSKTKRTLYSGHNNTVSLEDVSESPTKRGMLFSTPPSMQSRGQDSKTKRTLYSGHNKTVSSEDVSESPIKRGRLFSTPPSMQSRGQKMLNLLVPTTKPNMEFFHATAKSPNVLLTNKNDPFYSIRIKKE